MYRTIEAKPSYLILRRPRSWRGRLEGWPQARSRLWPSFETRASFDKLRSALLRTRLMDDIDVDALRLTAIGSDRRTKQIPVTAFWRLPHRARSYCRPDQTHKSSV